MYVASTPNFSLLMSLKAGLAPAATSVVTWLYIRNGVMIRSGPWPQNACGCHSSWPRLRLYWNRKL